MTLTELIGVLNEKAEELEEDFGVDPDEVEVRLAFQPSWPLQFTLGDVVSRDSKVVYLTEGNHPRDDSPYAPRWAFDPDFYEEDEEVS